MHSVGDRVGQLTPIRTEVRAWRRWWLCACDCGSEEKWIVAYSLNRNHCVSCGCVSTARIKSGLRRTHGMKHTPEYNAWCRMIRRCEDTRCDKYAYYGGRGISVCSEWRHDFSAFFSAMGPRPIGHTLDRINPDGNYEPANCRWATWETQHLNKRNTVRIPANGQTLTLREAAARLGISRQYTHKRWRRDPRALSMAIEALSDAEVQCNAFSVPTMTCSGSPSTGPCGSTTATGSRFATAK